MIAKEATKTNKQYESQKNKKNLFTGTAELRTGRSPVEPIAWDLDHA